MNKKSEQSPNTSELRRQAEAKLSNQKETTQPLKKADTMHFIHELQVHRIELEMQNEQLKQSQADVEAAYRQYTNLYDFAPVGYFTLARDGTIRNVNLSGANLMGMTHGDLINQPFRLFVVADSHPVFSAFLQKLLSGKGIETCEVALLKNGKEPLWARIEATCFESGQECHAAVMDISARVQAETALIESNNKLLSLITNIPGNVAYVNANTLKYEFVNSVFERSFGIPQEKIVGSHIKEIVGEKNYQVALKYIDIVRSGKSISYENTFNLVSGKRWVEVNYAPVFDAKGNVISIVVLSFDITERKQAEEQLKQQAVWTQFISDAVITTDLNFLITGWNEAATRIYGWNANEAIGNMMDELLKTKFISLPQIEAQAILKRTGLWQGQIQQQTKSGELVDMDVAATFLKDNAGNITGGITINRDITKRKQAEAGLRRAKKALEAANLALQTALIRQQQLAHVDALTGINNRGYLFELAEYEFNIAMRYQQPLSVIMFDIDHFKEINDTFGHSVGDQMLQRVTHVACVELRSADVIGRYGGEEFLVILPMTNALQAYPLAERIRASVAAIRMPTEKGNASVTLSIGIVEMQHNLQTESAENLIRRADEAMYAAKQAGRNRTEIGAQ